MPERKGRRRRPHDRRREERRATADAREGAERAPAPAAASRRTRQPAPPAPSATARATGFTIAVVTAFVAVLMIRDGVTGDRDVVDAVIRVVVGTLLVALATFIAVLLVFPEWVRGRWRR